MAAVEKTQSASLIEQVKHLAGRYKVLGMLLMLGLTLGYATILAGTALTAATTGGMPAILLAYPYIIAAIKFLIDAAAVLSPILIPGVTEPIMMALTSLFGFYLSFGTLNEMFDPGRFKRDLKKGWQRFKTDTQLHQNMSFIDIFAYAIRYKPEEGLNIALAKTVASPVRWAIVPVEVVRLSFVFVANFLERTKEVDAKSSSLVQLFRGAADLLVIATAILMQIRPISDAPFNRALQSKQKRSGQADSSASSVLPRGTIYSDADAILPDSPKKPTTSSGSGPLPKVSKVLQAGSPAAAEEKAKLLENPEDQPTSSLGNNGT